MHKILLLLLLPFYGQSQVKVKDLIEVYQNYANPYKTRAILEKAGFPNLDTVDRNAVMYSTLIADKEFIVIWPRATCAVIYTDIQEQFFSWQQEAYSLGFKVIEIKNNKDGEALILKKDAYFISILHYLDNGRKRYRLNYWY
jgi:hypothetical protein